MTVLTVSRFFIIIPTESLTEHVIKFLKYHTFKERIYFEFGDAF